MAFFKKVRKKVNGKWYPESVLVGSPVTTTEVADRLAAESTVSPADTRAVLTALGSVMADYMAKGRSVKLDGIGSFYLTANAEKNGADSEKEVTAAQIVGTRVRFIPETRYRAGAARIATRSLVDERIVWEELKDRKTAATPPAGGGENGENGGNEPLP
ncbi:MAG: HU family DNA-binding protein [Prevotellaceae bacterium]|nr:HU family DNA-binding protein [Prevotellaceae bacterium]